MLFAGSITSVSLAAMHSRTVFLIGHCTVIQCYAGGVSLADQ